MAQFQFIRRLDLTDDLTIDTSLLTAIGQFCGLRALTVYTGDNCSHLQDCLRALIELDIKGRAFHIQLFLSATSPSLLQRLSLFLRDPGTELLVQCISSVPTFVPATLSTLALESNLTFSPRPLTSIMDVVQPALALRTFAAFTFKPRPPLSISDTNIITMLSAWSMLIALRIASDHAYPHRPSSRPARPTALVFPAIVVRAPHLDTLELLEVDLSVTPTPGVLSGPRGGHSLRVLDMASDSLSDWNHADRKACLRAAVVLDRLFPRMELSGMRGKSDAYD